MSLQLNGNYSLSSRHLPNGKLPKGLNANNTVKSGSVIICTVVSVYYKDEPAALAWLRKLWSVLQRFTLTYHVSQPYTTFFVKVWHRLFGICLLFLERTDEQSYQLIITGFIVL
jgi:hypothetical protein